MVCVLFLNLSGLPQHVYVIFALLYQKKNYFLKIYVFLSREEAAIRELLSVSKDTRIGGPAEGAHVHIVHLSDSKSSLELIKVNI